MIRRLAERLARGRILRRTIQVAGRRVPIHISPDAQLKYLKPGARAFDADLLVLAEQRLNADSVVWDVGANVGTFSVAAATVANRGKVFAIEADIWLAGLLRRTAAEPAFAGRIQVIPCAVAAAAGVARFVIAARGRASNALEISGGRSQMGGARDIVLVPTLSLDTLLESLSPPSFVKIDVEGAELAVLEGAKRLLREVRPSVYIEVDEASGEAVFALFAQLGYAAHDPATGHEVSGCIENTLFVPLATTADELGRSQ